MRTIDQVKKHYQAQERVVISVPEWGEGDAPLEINIFPMTMAEASLIQRMSGKKASNIESAVNSLIVKARDKDGNRLFKVEDKETLLNFADCRVILRINEEIERHFFKNVEQAKGNSEATPSDTAS
jgi:hypothetical protein